MHARAILLAGLVSLPALAASAAPPADEHPALNDIANAVTPEALHSTIQALVGFGTRHTLSDTTSNTRGIGAARRWAKGRFDQISQACGGCLEVITPSQTVTGSRIPTPAEIVDVVAIQRGTTDPDRVIVITGHIDSRVKDVMDAKAEAPGADDDGSGTAAVLETARVLSKYKFAATLVYSIDSGEEQGLYGGKLIADYAHQHGWRVEADLNNDIVGDTTGQSGVIDNTHIRVFSEGTKAVESDKQAAARRYNGGEVDSPSRNLARYIDDLASRYLTHFSVAMVYRTDRYSRGGDQVPFLELGYPAVRFTEAVENYTREHQDVREEGGVRYGDRIESVDFPYLAQVTRLNAITMASLAWAPPPPQGFAIAGAVGSDTGLKWQAAPGAAAYRVYWRDTTAPRWEHSRPVADGTAVTLKDIIVDDWFFGVASVSADGFVSPVEFPGPAGSFVSEPPAEKASKP
jgi:Peptidase family M28